MESIQQNIRIAVLTYEVNEMRSVQKAKVPLVPYGTNNWLVRVYCIATFKLLENFRKTAEISLKVQFCENQTKR